MVKTRTFKLKRKRGVDEVPTMAFVGASQGDTSQSNDVANADNPWMMFMYKGIDRTDQKAVDEEYRRRMVEYNAYVGKLKSEGKYGEEFEYEITIIDNPIDYNYGIKDRENPIESHKMTIIDFSKDGNTTD